MSKILDITIEYEPSEENETLFNLKTGDWRRIPLNCWRGRIMIGSQQCETYGSNMIFDVRNKLEPNDVLTAQLALLETMRNDIDEAINELSKRIGQ